MIAVPYLEREGVGVAVASDRVDAVEVVVGRGRVRVRKSGSEPVGADGPGAALGRLVAALGLRGRVVHAHVDPAVVEVEGLDVPAFGDAEDVRVWLAGQAERAAPGGRVADAAVLGSVGAGGAPEATDPDRALVASAPSEAVEAARDLMEGAGLVVGRIGTGIAEAATPLVALDEAEAGALVVAEAGGGAVVELAGGHVRDARWVALGPDRLMDEVGVLVSPGARVAVGGGAATGVLASAGVSAHALSFEGGVGPELALAFGLALEAARPELRGLDVLDADTRAEADALEAKRTGQRAVLAVGVVVLVALLAVEAARIGFAGALSRAEARNALRADEVAEVEALRRDVERRRRDLATARRSARERTDMAGVVERVAYALPEGVWLSGLVVDSASVVVSGYALEAGLVAEVLGALEREPRIGGASLSRTTRLDPETSPEVSRPVVAFEVRGRLDAPDP